MNTDFSRNLVLLRKEKGISQKKASEDLNISQALLSHYEKGIRECGLEFVVRAAEYYGVSCDFMLGRSERREMYKPERTRKSADSLTAQLQNSITGSVYIVFAILKKINSQSLTKQVGKYLQTAVYSAFRALYSAKSSGSSTVFRIEEDMYPAVSLSKMAMSMAKCNQLLRTGQTDEKTSVNMESLKAENLKYANALQQLIEDSEKTEEE